MTRIRRFSRVGLLAFVVLPAAFAVVSTAGANHSPPLLEWMSAGSASCLPSCGNGATEATLSAASADGTRVFFFTDEPLVAADGDSSSDVYERSGGTTTLVSDRVQAGADGAIDVEFGARGISQDGTRVFFITSEALVAADGDSSTDVYERSGGTTTLVSDRVQAGADGTNNAAFGGNSQDGTRVFFETTEALVAADGDSSSDVYERSGGTTTLVSDRVQAGVDGANGAGFGGSSADGTRIFFATSEALVAADGDSSPDVYERSGGTTTLVSDRVQAGADGASTAFFRRASSDGTRVFFQTDEPILTADGDTSTDIYERFGGTTTLVTDRIQAGADGANDAFIRGASQDGTRVFFVTTEPLVTADGDSSSDVYERSGGTTTLVSDRIQSGADATIDAFFTGSSHDGTRVFFVTIEPIVTADGDTAIDVYERSGGTTTLVSDRIQSGADDVANASFYGASADGTRVFFQTTEQLLSTDTDSLSDYYERARGVTTLVSIGPDTPTGSAVGSGLATINPVSLDGKRIFFTTTESLLSADTDTSFDVYMARAPTGYPRPQAATPLRVPLVTAYTECTAANRAHEAPFAAPSCDPPIQTSQFLTVGTADANGQPTKSAGYVLMTVRPGNASTTQDEADIDLAVQLTDVRNQRDLSDYAGELQANSNLRITDRRNGASLAEPGTVAELPFPFTVVCTTTPADNTVGSICAAATSADAVLAGAIKETKRTIMKVNDLRVFDGGPDGDAETPGNTLFAEQGLFVP